MIVALARKLLIALWRLVTTGEVPEGVRPAAGGVNRHDRALQEQTVSARRPQTCDELPMTIRGGGDPTLIHGFDAAMRMGPPPGASPPMRMAASWFGSPRIHRIQGCGAMIRARWRAPLDRSRPSLTSAYPQAAARRVTADWRACG